jgi:phenylacetate-coenzyme A ligase PaaK-like adenylate-forming protein
VSLVSLARLHAPGLLPEHERLGAFQDQQVRGIVAHAAQSVPYYRELFRDAGIAPDDVRGVADLPAIPASTKDDLRRCPESRRTAADHARLIRHMTNGSSGKPFRVVRTHGEELALGAVRELAKARLGARPWHRAAWLLDPAFVGGRRLLPARLGACVGLFRVHGLDPEHRREELAEQLIRLAPEVVCGYTSVVAQVASALSEVTSSWRPRCVFTGGETLSPAAQHKIEAGFGVPVSDLYAASEFNLLAYDCPGGANTMHAAEDGVILEVVCDGHRAAPGEAGSVVATALHSRAMPFIRYDTGDRAIRGPQPCPCGWPGTTLLSVEGRVIEMFRLPDGRLLHPVAVVGATAGAEHGWVDEHRLIQEREDLIIMQLVPLREPSERNLQEIRATAQSVLGPDVQLRVELIPGLPDEPGQKRRPFISRVAGGI